MSTSYAIDGDVAVITLDRPDQFNAINQNMADHLVEDLTRAGTEARAAVITGAGRAFCAGADLAMIDETTDLHDLLEEIFHPALLAITGASVPVVAAINGVAAGAGLGLALACDLRLIAANAFLTSAFTAIGLAPDSGTTWSLPRHVGISRALEMTMTNRRVQADETVQLGLCVDAVEDEMVVQAAIDLASSLCDLVPDALVTTRNLIRGASSKTFEEAILDEQREQSRLGKTREHKEGVAAFLEKRPPDFRNPGGP